MLGSVDSNTGSPDLGWDTDQFPMDIRNTTMVMKVSQNMKVMILYVLKHIAQQTLIIYLIPVLNITWLI